MPIGRSRRSRRRISRFRRPVARTGKSRRFVIGRRAAKRFHRGLTRVAVQRGIRPVADSQIVNMHYVESITITGVNPGSPVSHIYRANSIFDPSFTGTGHQPLGHDQWAAFYDHYTVIGSKMTARIVSQGNTTADQCFAIIYLDDDTTGPASFQEFLENARRAPKIINMATGLGQGTVLCKYSPRKFFALDSIKDNRDQVGASFGVNPTDGAFFNLSIAPITSSATFGTFSVLVSIQYLCLLTEPKTLPSS